MTKYITRVELHRATEADYFKLHTAMEQKGFKRQIQSDDGKVYKLPPAEYYVDTTSNIAQVQQAAQHAANLTSLKNAILVAQTSGFMWSGLELK